MTMENTAPLSSALLLLLALQAKHFICDGPLQTLRMVQSKSHYGWPLGLLHAGIHLAATAGVLLGFGVPAALALKLAAAEGVLHYHIDFTKENVVKTLGWTVKDAPYWWALTLDQTLHHMTYVGLVWLIFKS